MSGRITFMLGPGAGVFTIAPPSCESAPPPGDGALDRPPHAASTHTTSAALTRRSYRD
jgi:hypothetical protein